MTSKARQGEDGGSQTVRALLRLREMILSGQLPAGERIAEPAVAEATGISRTPIRAALIRLQEEGLIEPIRSGGFRVRAFSAAEIRDAIEVRGVMEGLAARLAAERGVGRAALSVLQGCVREIDDLLASGELDEARFAAYVEANARFHDALAGASGSEVVQRQVVRANALPFASANGFVRVQAASADARRTLTIANAQHAAVIEAIAQREGGRAEALMREHARIAHRNLEHVLDNPAVIGLIPGGCLIQGPRDAAPVRK
ncbi:GntR family transcriptional regulator [Denitromonas iodatirespirans]|uniref:GntR family transcriptional regulator n=1 Tax=Denitromonas iodatirespirans TaxID=2795389 RepID=A0A944DEG5_DENI1|nr:GntR family transcriptional regulator [Denitromonas iodatirespirans]MBT0962953.1 GntR family transcriptional regulator [Denitromonas iodatirespirans]